MKKVVKMYIYKEKVYPNALLAIITFSINFNYCRTVEQQRHEHYYSKKLNINSLSSSSISPPIQQPVFATSNTLSPPPPITLPDTAMSDTVEMQFVQEKYKLLDQLNVNKTALFRSIIKKRSTTSNTRSDNNNYDNINYASRSLLVENLLSTSSAPLSAVSLPKFSITHANNETFASVINDTTQQSGTTTQTLVLTNIINNNANDKSSDNDSNIYDHMQLCDEFENENCMIDHTVVCVGDPQYCNLTKEQYTGLLLEYITPTTSEWILIVSHSVVFIMGLVSIVYCYMSVKTFDILFT